MRLPNIPAAKFGMVEGGVPWKALSWKFEKSDVYGQWREAAIHRLSFQLS